MSSAPGGRPHLAGTDAGSPSWSKKADLTPASLRAGTAEDYEGDPFSSGRTLATEQMMSPLSLRRVKGSMCEPLLPEAPMPDYQSLQPLPSPRAADVLLALARAAPSQTWTMLDSSALAGELGLRISDLVQLLKELEALALVERWPLGSLVYLTENGRALAAELERRR